VRLTVHRQAGGHMLPEAGGVQAGRATGVGGGGDWSHGQCQMPVIAQVSSAITTMAMTASPKAPRQLFHGIVGYLMTR
jgi:hypothetical protein